MGFYRLYRVLQGLALFRSPLGGQKGVTMVEFKQSATEANTFGLYLDGNIVGIVEMWPGKDGAGTLRRLVTNAELLAAARDALAVIEAGAVEENESAYIAVGDLKAAIAKVEGGA